MHLYQTDRSTFARGVFGATMAIALLAVAACGGGGGDGSPALAVQAAPTITTQPASTTVTAPATATFSVAATGTPSPTYQWSVGGVAIPGATLASYSTAATTTAMSGANYTVTVTNSAGSVTSAPVATLTVAAVQMTTSSPAIAWDGVNRTAGGFNYTQGTYLIGFQFKANRAIAVNQLGAYDSSLGSMPSGAQTFQSTPVGLYNLSTHTLLGSVTVTGSSTATSVYRYAALSTPVTLNTTDTYAVVWVTGTNHYVATQFNPIIAAKDVNAAVSYVAFAGYGPGGLTQTTTIAEPDFFYVPGLNYDIGSNFLFQ